MSALVVCFLSMFGADEQVHAWSFRNHVQSVLTKSGCNSGACHGAIAGKNGLRLSLRGFDASGDYDALVRQVGGRRVDLDEPGASLMLLKATARVPHGGGKRFDEGSRDFKILAQWIAAGAEPPTAKDASIQKLEILSKDLVLAPAAKQLLRVEALFSDGKREDVTSWTKFASLNGEVVHVGDDGVANVVGRGESAVTAWYLNKLAVVRIAVPHDPPPAQTDAGAVDYGVERSVVDRLVNEKLRMLKIPPAGLCADGDFIRRAFVDTIGVLPTSEEVRRFLADQRPEKRDRLIDDLLGRPEFVDYWSYRWSDLLLVNSEKLKPAGMWSYYRWIRSKVADDVPWDAFVRELLEVQGDSLEAGAANFYVLHSEPTDLIETISTAFMGMSLNCCRCHNHPLEKWTNDDYYGFLNLVARVKRKNGEAEGQATVFVSESGDLVQPHTGRIHPPRPLDSSPTDPADPRDRRQVLATWLTSSSNPYFTRAIVNRIWANFMGTGLVEKVDDLRLTNPASNEQLLRALTSILVEEKHQLKALMRRIMQSTAYQRASAPLPGSSASAADRRHYSRYFAKRLPAEVLLDAVSQVVEVPSQFPGYPAGFRAMQLPDAKAASAFLDKFGRPNREITCDCERSNEPSMVQVLHLSNGDVVNRKLSTANNRIGRWLSAGLSVDAMMDDFYLAALCRTPTEKERKQIKAGYQEAPADDRRRYFEDVCWAVIGSKEFLFNH